MSKLPEKPSALIRLALSDLEKAESDSRYKINMAIWHMPPYILEQEGKCDICLAGAVMAGTLQADIGRTLLPCNFDEEKDALLALDHFRSGHVWNGLDYLKKEVPEQLMDYQPDITDYALDSAAFKRDMADLASTLEEYGL